ncbi:MAG: hypothetical protein NVS2B16_37420 [Chloroflexota bacterium]
MISHDHERNEVYLEFPDTGGCVLTIEQAEGVIQALRHTVAALRNPALCDHAIRSMARPD